jgi:hypothetical protein
MKKYVVLIVVLLALTILSTGCGISQGDYDKMVAEKDNLISQLQTQISAMIPTPKYFENRTAIQNWLNSVPKLGISKDPEEWYRFALYYQQKALEVGYIISVAYWRTSSKSIVIWCEVIAQDGWIYYFDPDDCVLIDTNIRIDSIIIEDTVNIY